ncbi:hypothetical protein N9934_02510 [Desulfosarcina sp.]|nr:hypothetical protein [Desulfosarcina sp.]
MKKLQTFILASVLIGSFLISTHNSQAQSLASSTSENISFYTNQHDFWAGEDATICIDREFKTEGISTYVGTTFWGTNGDGYFSNSLNLKTSYYPGPEDIASGQVTLSLVVLPGPGAYPMMDQMVLHLFSCETVKQDER